MKNKDDEIFLNEGYVYSELHDKCVVFLSEHDLKHPAVKDAIKHCINVGILTEDYTVQDILEKIFGFNLNEEWEKEVVEHKTLLSNKKVKGVRYSGYERCDIDWIESPMCSPKMKSLYQNLVAKERGRF